MLKMFMAAVGTSAASLALLSVVAPTKFAAARAKVSHAGGSAEMLSSHARSPAPRSSRCLAARRT